MLRNVGGTLCTEGSEFTENNIFRKNKKEFRIQRNYKPTGNATPGCRVLLLRLLESMRSESLFSQRSNQNMIFFHPGIFKTRTTSEADLSATNNIRSQSYDGCQHKK